MENLDRQSALFPNRDRFIDRLHQLGALAPHVCGVDTSILGGSLCHSDQLSRGRVASRRINQRGGHPQSAVLHGRFHDGLHACELFGVRLSRGIAQHFHTSLALVVGSAEIHADAAFFEFREIFRKLFRCHWRTRFARDSGGHAHSQFAFTEPVP